MIDRSYFWSDSQVVLGYIKNETSRFHVFVANRISQIRHLTDPSSWSYVRSASNPADLLTRSCCSSVSKLDDKWFCGPSWLHDYKSEWPVHDVTVTLARDDPEVKTSVASAAVTTFQPDSDPVSKVISYFSDWNKMQRALAWLCRYVSVMSKRSKLQGGLTVQEIAQAKISLIKHVQGLHYKGDLCRLASGNVY